MGANERARGYDTMDVLCGAVVEARVDFPAKEGRPIGAPYLLGVTGNIACGKSTVLARLAEHGAETIDADRVVHALMEPGETVWSAVREAFGDGILTPAGQINRRALGAIVFNDPAQLARLERISHPAVRVRIVAMIDDAARRDVRVVVIDAIKLYEGGLAERCDETWVVICDPAQQLARLMARNGFDAAEARRRIAAQPPQAEKITRADVVIDNSGLLDATRAQVDAAWARSGARRASGRVGQKETNQETRRRGEGGEG